MKLEDITIGASEAGAVIGVDPYRSPMQLYMRKLGLDEDSGDSEAAFIGRHVEHALASMFEETHGVKLHRHDPVFGTGDLAFARATPDRVIYYDDMPADFRRAWAVEPGEALLVEIKTAGIISGRVDGHEWGATGSDVVPAKYAVQSQMQARLLSDVLEDMGAGFVRRTIVYALLGGRGLDTFVVHRKDDIVDDVLRRMHTFVHQHLVPEVPPPAITEEDWRARVEATRTQMISKTIYPATAEDIALAESYRAAQSFLKDAKLMRERLRAQLCERIGDAYGIEGDFGRIIYTAGKDVPKLGKPAFVDDVLELVNREAESEDMGRRKLARQIIDIARKRTRVVHSKRSLRATFNGDDAEEQE